MTNEEIRIITPEPDEDPGFSFIESDLDILEKDLDKEMKDDARALTDDAIHEVAKSSSAVLNMVIKALGAPGITDAMKAELYLSLGRLATIAAAGKKKIRPDFKMLGDTDIILPTTVCEIRITESEVLDTAAWKKNDPMGYRLTKMDYSKVSERISVKFRDKKGV